MIIYRDDQPPLLSEYGIEVPMLKGRAEKIKEEIEKHYGPHFFTSTKTPVLSEEDFLAVHTRNFLDRCLHSPAEVIQETFELINPDGSYHRYNPQHAQKPLAELVPLFKKSCGDSYLNLVQAFETGFSYYLGGGFHHALSSRGRGFCLFNDIMIAAKKFQKEVNPGKMWVIDIDAHKGCGTAEIAQNDPEISTLSIHMGKGWPLDSERLDKQGNLNPWFIPSSVDVDLPANTEGSYLERLKQGLSELEKKSPSPVACIVVDGSDPFEGDALPSANLLRLSKETCLERNLLVYNFLKSKNIPQAYLMSGGYGEKNWIIHYQFIAHVLNQLQKI